MLRRRHFALGLPTLFFLSLVLCPWLWKGLPDSYFAYSGLVVEKGTEFHLITGDNHWDNYLILEDPQGRRTKKYLSDTAYTLVQTGTMVVKKRGFGEFPLRAGQHSPSELRHLLEKPSAQTH